MAARFLAPFAGRSGVCVALAALVFASRAWLVDVWGSPVPFWDQWDAEAALYRAWLGGTLGWSDLFSAHNEHRILLTRVANLVLFVACDGWNPWAQLLLNAALHASVAAVLAALFWPALSPGARVFFVSGLAVIFSATAGWQNALWGFQSQVYFTNLLAVGAIAMLALAPPASSRRWLGLVLLALALFASAGGLLAVLASLVVVFPRRGPPREWTGFLTVLSVAAAGLALHALAPQHEPLHAQSVGQFLAVFTRSLSWPQVDSSWLWLLTQMPLAALAVMRWRARTTLDAAERAALALAAFAMLQAAAIAYSRGGGLPEFRPLSRYQDPLLLGTAAQWFAALRLATVLGRRGRLLALAWTAVIAIGLLTLTTTNLTFNLPYKRVQDTVSLARVRSYLATGDGRVFTADPQHLGPHPDPKVVQRVLDDPVLRPFLPKPFFSRESESAPLLKPAAIAQARTLVLLASIALGAALMWTHRASQRPHLPAAAPPRA